MRSLWITVLLLGSANAARASTPAHPLPGSVAVRHRAVTRDPRLSLEAARNIAQARVPRGRIKSHELEQEAGHLIDSFDFAVPGRSGIDEVNVDARSGRVLALTHEDPRDERREKRSESHDSRRPGPGR